MKCMCHEAEGNLLTLWVFIPSLLSCISLHVSTRTFCPKEHKRIFAQLTSNKFPYSRCANCLYLFSLLTVGHTAEESDWYVCKYALHCAWFETTRYSREGGTSGRPSPFNASFLMSYWSTLKTGIGLLRYKCSKVKYRKSKQVATCNVPYYNASNRGEWTDFVFLSATSICL